VKEGLVLMREECVMPLLQNTSGNEMRKIKPICLILNRFRPGRARGQRDRCLSTAGMQNKEYSIEHHITTGGG